MAAAGLEGEPLGENHRVHRQRRIKVRKQRSAARGLEAQVLAEPFWVNRNEQQISVTAEIFLGGLFSLRGCREMDEPILKIDRSAVEPSLVLSLSPQSGGSNFIDQIHDETFAGLSARRADLFLGQKIGMFANKIAGQRVGDQFPRLVYPVEGNE